MERPTADRAAPAPRRRTPPGLETDTGGAQDRAHGDHDFVMSPRFVATDRIRFIAWDHPNMPWNDTSLRAGISGRDG